MTCTLLGCQFLWWDLSETKTCLLCQNISAGWCSKLRLVTGTYLTPGINTHPLLKWRAIHGEHFHYRKQKRLEFHCVHSCFVCCVGQKICSGLHWLWLGAKLSQTISCGSQTGQIDCLLTGKCMAVWSSSASMTAPQTKGNLKCRVLVTFSQIHPYQFSSCHQVRCPSCQESYTDAPCWWLWHMSYMESAWAAPTRWCVHGGHICL